MRWGRFLTFLVIVLAVLGLTVGTSLQLWKTIPLGLDLRGGFDLLYKVQPGPDGKAPDAQGIKATVQAIETRVNKNGFSSPNIDVEHTNWIRVQLAGTFDQQKAEAIIGQTANLEIYGSAVQQKVGTSLEIVPPPNTKPLLTGKDLKSDAHWAVDQTNGQNVVVVNFKDPSLWQKVTKEYYQKPIYTFLNGKLITYPTVESIISSGSTQISGVGTAQECMTLAAELNAGALPYPLQIISQNNVGPSLGAASLMATMWAGLAAVILIFLFMMLVYRMAGLIANISLIAYTYVVLLTFSGLHVVLTLSGLAALVLGIGMAVDANIITYERIKDEMRNGRSLQSSVITGNKRALRTILDSNATTFIAGAVMYWFGQGDIRGFAVALMLSIVISLLTAVLLSRAMLLLFTRSNVVKRPWWFGIGKGVLQR